MARMRARSVFRIIVLIVVVGLLVFGYIRYYVPFSDAGVQAGILNRINHKGFIFKTYEGKLIQSGFGAGRKGLQSNDFDFSVENKDLAEKLMKLSGQQVKVHYKEYFGALPWRGYSRFVVDSILDWEPADKWEQDIPPQVEM